MPTPDHVRQIALSFPEATEQPHFDKILFRAVKKIFATLNASQQRATVKLSAEDQDLFTLYDPTIPRPVPSRWGRQGWTQIDLARVPEAMPGDALPAAYCEVTPPQLAEALRSQRTTSAPEEDWGPAEIGGDACAHFGSGKPQGMFERREARQVYRG